MADIRFRFDLDKLVSALAYFSTSGITDLTKLKAAKLLYLADQYHLYRHGRPITGDRYIAMDLGPVPEDAFQLISRLLEPTEVDDASRRRALELLVVYRGVFRRYPILRARRAPDLDVFSDSEIEALDATIQTHGHTPARALVDLTHEHRAYKKANAGRATGSSVALPYEFFFEDAPDNLREQAMDRAASYQEALDFADTLRTVGVTALAEQRKLTTAS